MATSDKLTYLNTTKGLIKDAINNAGANITNDTFRSYATTLGTTVTKMRTDRDILVGNGVVGTSTGSISGALNYPLNELKMTKESTQKTTIGKNKFDKSLTPYSLTNTSVQELPTGIRAISTVNGPSGSNNAASFKVIDVANLEGQTITLSAYAKSSSTNKGFMYLRLIKENGDVTSDYGTITSSSTLDGDLSISYTIPSGIGDYHYLRVSLYSTRDSAVSIGDYVDYTNLQLEISSSKTSYEPYTGGIASPNPSYPQEVKTVKGYRNLFNVNAIERTDYYIAPSTGQHVTQGGSIIFTIEIKPNTSYIRNKVKNESNLTFFSSITFYDSSMNYISGSWNANELIETPNNAKYTILSTSFNSTLYSDTDDFLNSFQLIEGTTQKPYVPYGTNWIYTTITDGTNTKNIPLPLNNNEPAGMGDYKDEYIVDKNGHCWLNKKTNKVVLDGSESWNYQSSSGNLYVENIVSDKANINTALEYSKCNNYLYFGLINDGLSTLTENNKFAFQTNNSAVYGRVAIRDTRFTSADDFKTWLSTHNTEIYYPLATENLIDLNYNVDLTLYSGTNTITNSEDMDMAIKYVEDINTILTTLTTPQGGNE